MTEVYRVGYLERLPLGTPYPSIVAYIGRLLGRLPGAELVIDFTGVGRPVFDMFRFSGITPTGVLITSGIAETGGGPIHGVPKLDLVSRLQALLHEGRLKIHKDLAEADTLVRELQDFRCEFTAAGHLTFNARSGKHDDLVLALAIAVWRAADGGMNGAGWFRYYQRARRRRSAAARRDRGRPRPEPRPDRDRHRAARGRSRWPGDSGRRDPSPATAGEHRGAAGPGITRASR